MIRTRTAAAAALPILLLASAARAQTGELPRTHAPGATVAGITPGDLMSRLYVLADDSMMGREAGTIGNVKGTNYVAAQFRAIGLESGGENGGFFQTVPLIDRGMMPGASLSAAGTPLNVGQHFVPLFYLGPYAFSPNARAANAPVVFGGRIGGQTITAEQARGKVVILLPPMQNGQENFRWWRVQGVPRYPDAAAIAIASLDATPAGTVEALLEPSTEIQEENQAPDPSAVSGPGMIVSRAAAERMLGAPLAAAKPGDAGKTVSAAWRFGDMPTEAPARNVIGILRGSDPALRGQYVVISAHNDHEGILAMALDHDSVRAYNRVMRPQGANDPVGTPTPQQQARIAALRDSLRRAHGGAVRLDSIMNGADDDGSGTVTLIEIAQSLAAGERPRRSILFMSHTGEEKGLYGSQWFTDHPTVPRDSIVTDLNMDMVGRGRAEDVAHGGPWSIQMIGSRRLSTQLGALIDSLNAGRPNPMQIDYSFDAHGHPLNRYCRSDHFMYARYGIPITYFSLGYHVDYHQPTDEPQYIDYDHMARVGAFVRDIALAVANRPERLVVDGPRQDPNAPCRQ
ncbi:M28 family peptidase [Longimicrobium sp.]|uniref:M28 family peptidase n=1 Tax=Longimicrobium sp. TaxID=2029185 RepID=UPI002D1E2C7E|nr:M28 family peptidase [Longimicrobium sp.]HSU16496.1 M28 family peptidase [Longimicrobium sp.]